MKRVTVKEFWLVQSTSIELPFERFRDEMANRQESWYKNSLSPYIKEELRVEAGDAFRHSYVSAKFAEEYFAVLSQALGFLHELDSKFFSYDSQMDLHNNAIGRELASKWAGDSMGLVLGFWSAVMDGSILVIDRDENGREMLRYTSVDDLQSFDGDRLDDRYYYEYEFSIPPIEFDDAGPYNA